MSFKLLYNVLTKGSLLEDAFELTGTVHNETHKMFRDSTNALMEHNDEIKKKVIKKDKRVNRDFIKIRKKIFEYLSVAAAPNISACLVLSNVAIDYERIGDYCKNIAQLIDYYPVKFRDGYYQEKINRIIKSINEMFEITSEAIMDEDEEKAGEVLSKHAKIKEIHHEIVNKLNNDNDIQVKEAIVIAKMGAYLRRVSAHLGNICTGVIRPFPKMGFLKKSLKAVKSASPPVERTKLD